MAGRWEIQEHPSGHRGRGKTIQLRAIRDSQGVYRHNSDHLWSNGDMIVDAVAWGYTGDAISDISLGAQSYGRVCVCVCAGASANCKYSRQKRSGSQNASGISFNSSIHFGQHLQEPLIIG